MKTGAIAASAAMTALLLAIQFMLHMAVGVELVTVLFLAFCCSFGLACAIMTATAFSLLRCLLFGFTPAVIVLYLIYYNLFALVFALFGKRSSPAWMCPLLLALLMCFTGYFAATGLPVSSIYAGRLKVMLWLLFGFFAALSAFYVILLAVKRGKSGRELASAVALAAVMTVCFTLLDDVITPLFSGMSASGAAAYFYTGFTAMIPQVIFVSLSVTALYLPLKKTFAFLSKKLLR